MPTTALEALLETDRHRRRATDDVATMVVNERTALADEGPFFVSNMRKDFVQTGLRSGGVVWAGFSQWDLHEEEDALQTLYQRLQVLSEVRRWTNRCRTVVEAVERMKTFGHTPYALVLAFETLKDTCGVDLSPEEIRKLMFAQGRVAEVDGLSVYASTGLRGSQAIVATKPNLVGLYTRVDTSLALMVRRADKSLVLVG